MIPDEAWDLIEQGLLPSERERARAEFHDLLARTWDDGYAIGWNDGHNHGDLRSSPDNPYEQED